MEVKWFIPVLLIITVATRSNHAAASDSRSQHSLIRNNRIYNRNNPFNLPTKKVLFHQLGVVFDLYKAENEVKNLVVPMYGYKDFHEIYPTAENHPPIFFNMYNNGTCLGQYVLKNRTAYKISDGRDSAFEIPDINKPGFGFDFDKNVYIGGAAGIQVYNMDTGELTKYGTVTADIISIDKVNEKDEFYIVSSKNIVYKVINNGNDLVPVEAIPYAKDLVLDYFENAYFIGEDNKPQVLMKGNEAPIKFEEFNFDVVKPLLGREVLNALSKEKEAMIPFFVDGVLYILSNNKSECVPTIGVVPGLTAFSAEYAFDHYYAVDGLIYHHAVLGHKRPSENIEEAESAENSIADSESDSERPVEVFERDVQAEYKTLKKIKRKH